MRLAVAIFVVCLLFGGIAAAQDVPVANAGPPVVVTCAGPDGTPALVDGSQSSVGEGITYLWTAPDVEFQDPTLPSALGFFPVGSTVATLTVTFTDGTGAETTASSTTTVTVSDSTPPRIFAAPDPSELWPPNHKFHDIHVDIMVFDGCDANPDVELVSISSNEPDNGIGDGNTSGDIQGAEIGTDDRDFSLLAERSGPGSGRVYTALYRAFDLADLSSDAVAQVVVPHDMGQGGGSGDDGAWRDAEHQVKKLRKASAKAYKKQLKAAKKAAKKAKKAYKKALKASR